MNKLVNILNALCLALLLLSNLFHLPSVTDKSNVDMESVVNMADPEEAKVPSDEPTTAFMEEHELPPFITDLLTISDKPTFYTRCTTELQWQHTETLLLPPERGC